ncbi:MAG: hypothetical protein WCE54_02575 [Ignavibacteriaceae bacterium]
MGSSQVKIPMKNYEERFNAHLKYNQPAFLSVTILLFALLINSGTKIEHINMIFILICQSIIETAAVSCVIIFFVISIFQFLLAFGAPFGNLAWGGKYRILPFPLRIGSFISGLIFIISAIVMMEKIKLITVINSPALISVLIWLLVIIFGLSGIGNFMSKSKWEKRIMTPIALTLFLLCLVIAISD